MPGYSVQEAEKGLEADVDGWNDEPTNPRNWTVGRKWRNAAIVSLYTFITYARLCVLQYEPQADIHPCLVRWLLV